MPLTHLCRRRRRGRAWSWGSPPSAGWGAPAGGGNKDNGREREEGDKDEIAAKRAAAAEGMITIGGGRGGVYASHSAIWKRVIAEAACRAPGWRARARRAGAGAVNEPEAGPLSLRANISGNDGLERFIFFLWFILVQNCCGTYFPFRSCASLTDFHFMGFNFLNVNLFENIWRKCYGTFQKFSVTFVQRQFKKNVLEHFKSVMEQFKKSIPEHFKSVF